MFGLRVRDCHQVGLEIISPKSHIRKKAKQPWGELSEPDRLSLFTAIDSAFVLVTNDNELRQVCKENDVRTLRGLRLLINLVEVSGYPVKNVKKIVDKIHENNPIHINSKIVNDFYKELENVANN